MSDTSSNSSTKPYICDQCGKSYSKPSLLNQHIRSHTNERPFKCSFSDCDKSFLRKSHLQAHSLSHEEESHKPFVCSICGKGVNTKQHLKRHEITHTKSFRCPEPGCEESFYKHQSLRHHQLSVHERSLTCKLCNKTFSRPYRLAQHNLKYHSETPVYQCDQHSGCYANFKTWSALQFHIKTEHPKLKCPECGKGCVGKKGLESHMMIHDQDRMVKLWHCRYCEVGQFARKFDLIEHYNKLHDGNVPDDLLKSAEKEELEKLLQEKEGGKFVLMNSDDEDENGVDVEHFQGDDGSRSIESLNSTLKSGKSSIIELISSNFQQRKIQCPKKNCDRKFARDYDLKRHLVWHESHMEKIESFLSSLEDEQEQEPEEENRKRQIVDLSSDYKRRKDNDEYHDERGYSNGQQNDDEDDDEDFNNLIDEEIKKISERHSQDSVLT
ncbi:transcription factor IIIA [[Candida] railenensis]|uniref:Transcription factor IIIA n=1 Tax=[Candida] railenensis TaxID=45579 RepID=A0A9P0VXV5_9ASCO|nr:transcription factor IIIA [[Candida] railenensis]